MLSKKAQYAFEFLVFFSIITLVFTIIITAYGETRLDVQKAKEKKVIESYGAILQKEFFIAVSVHAGYSRNFTIPYRIDGIYFDANNTLDNQLNLNSSGFEVSYTIPLINGFLKKGFNKICNNNTIVYLNQC